MWITLVIIVFTWNKGFSKSITNSLRPGLATGALTSLGSFGMDEILGQGVQTGGFRAPQNKIDKLIALKME